MNELDDFHDTFGADTALAEELLLSTARGLPMIGVIVASLKAVYGPDVTEADNYSDRLKECVRVLKALEAHGLMRLPAGMFT